MSLVVCSNADAARAPRATGVWLWAWPTGICDLAGYEMEMLPGNSVLGAMQICIALVLAIGQRVCLAGWLSVTAGIVSKRLNLFRPSGTPIIEAFGTLARFLRRYQIPRGTPSSGRLIHGGAKSWRFSTDIAVYLGNGAR